MLTHKNVDSPVDIVVSWVKPQTNSYLAFDQRSDLDPNGRYSLEAVIFGLCSLGKYSISRRTNRASVSQFCTNRFSISTSLWKTLTAEEIETVVMKIIINWTGVTSKIYLKLLFLDLKINLSNQNKCISSQRCSNILILETSSTRWNAEKPKRIK